MQEEEIHPFLHFCVDLALIKMASKTEEKSPAEAPVLDLVLDRISGEAADKAIRKMFLELRRAVTKDEVPDNLFAKGVLTQETFELSTNVGLSGLEKGRKILLEIQHLVRYNPEKFETFCIVLEEHGHGTKDLIKKLRDLNNAEYTSLSRKSNSAYEALKEHLSRDQEDLSKPDAPTEIIEGHITFTVETYVKEMISSGATKKELDEQLYEICFEMFLVPARLSAKIQSLTETFVAHNKKIDPVEDSEEDQQEVVPSEPLPTLPPSELKEVLYHSTLCCHAVTSCPSSYSEFFTQNGHLFKAISMSQSDYLEGCLIAIKGDTKSDAEGGVVYIAFRSEPKLSDWIIRKGYDSFEHGLEEQSKRISYAFFFEQLEKKKKLVFTGFSFGGLLASYVTATLWKESYIPITDLEKNVVCVTYGQPLVKVPLVEHVVKCYEHFQDTVYHVYDREDTFPRVLRYFSSKQHTMTPLAPSSTKSEATSDLGGSQKFSQDFPQSYLKQLVSLQSEQNMPYSMKVRATSSSSDNAAQKLKALLESIPQGNIEVDCTILPGRYCYLTSSLRKWTEFPSKEFAASMLHTVPDAFTGDDFSKHDMKRYIKNVGDSFLSRDPSQFTKPLSSTKPTPKVDFLKPKVNSADIHIYENEHAVVLEGENLSFCYEVQLGDMKNALRIDTPALISPCMIRFNFPPTDKTRQINIRDESIKVALSSHFSKEIRQRIKLKTENFLFSVRQIQVAKYTPAEVIQLAFMSALLERRLNDEKYEASERFKTITDFLQEAVKVVPIESIFHAIAYLEDSDDALECANAVVSSKTAIPYYSLSAANFAAIRIGAGLRAHDFIAMVMAHSNFRFAQSFILESVSFQNRLSVCCILRPESALVSYSAATQNILHVPPMVVINTPKGLQFAHVTGFDFKVELVAPLPPAKLEVAKQLQKLVQTRTSASDTQYCKLSIERIYPVDSRRRHTMTMSTLESPREVLQKAREALKDFLEDSQEESDTSQCLVNEKMLELIRDTYNHKLKLCAALLASFMESQIHIPLLKDSSLSTANFLSTNSSPHAVGVWALFTKTFQDLQSMLASTRGNPLLVKITDYIYGVLGEGVKKPSSRNSKYDGKLQFLLQGSMDKTVTSSMEYVSYSLEHQLCKHLKFDKKISVTRLVEKWDEIFKGDALSLIAKSHRYITARWLKWAILIHDLRLTLAKYTCVGVTGLVNSGKSQLVRKLFGVQTRVGSLEKTRTTIPLLYNLDGVVDGLDVIDFPGVDDKDNNVPKLAEILLGLAQVVVFVCDYRRIFTDQAKEWIKQLESRDVPVVVCLTFADNLYSQFITDDAGNPNPSKLKQRKIKHELELKKEKIGRHVSRVVDFYCFDVPVSYRKEINAKSLGEAGVKSPLDVGDELVEIFKKKFKQENVATKLQDHLHALRSPSSPKP